MAAEEWVLVDKVQGAVQAEMLRGLLEAQGIMVWVNQQGASRAYAVTVGMLGMVEILVPSDSVEQARKVLEAYYRGDFENMELDGPDSGNNTEE